MSDIHADHRSATRGHNVTAVLGPTNTGKTHLAIERMLGHSSGIIGLPLRLLAREVYARIVERIGADKVALVTGEEKIKPPEARYWVSTVEAMPRDLEVAFVAVDEVQLGADLERGHVFTDRILRRRGREETLLLGAATARPLLARLMPGLNVITRPRLSQLSYAGQKKITRLPSRSAVVAFSADEVYAIAELIRRQRGGAAVVLGALSPRTRNAQVALYQSGEVDFLVATDAIGMGLNLDVDHVAFASRRKFDGFQFRDLNPAEMGQVAGRAGRHMRDGTFGVTGRLDPLEPDLVEKLEGHDFEPLRLLQWRNPDLDFSSVENLRESLAVAPSEVGLARAPDGIDVETLDALMRDPELRDMAGDPAAVELMWDVCQVPDYRKIAPANHIELVATLYRYLRRDGRIPDDWFAAQIAQADRTEGEIDTLATRIAHVRTWTFVANRPDWLADPTHWQEATRALEDRLSDALHERLTQRFVDRRTAVLARRLKESGDLETDVDAGGDVSVEGHHVGRLEGLRFSVDPSADAGHAKAASAAARKGLAAELGERAEALARAKDEAISLSLEGLLMWRDAPVGQLERGERVLAPRVALLADETLAGAPRERAEKRLADWVAARVTALLGPLTALEADEDLSGMTRGLAFQIVEALGILERTRVSEEVRGLPQSDRAALRRHGVRFGAHHIHVPALIKPAPRILAAQLWALHHGGLQQPGFADLANLTQSGRMSIAVAPGTAKGLYQAFGFRVCGARAIRVDILERLADLIRTALSWKPDSEAMPPPGAVDGRVFAVTEGMTSLAGCAGEDFAQILSSLGYRREMRPNLAAEAASAASEPQSDTAETESEATSPTTTTVNAAEAEGTGSPAGDSTPEAPPAEIAVWRPVRPGGSRRPEARARRNQDAEAPAQTKRPGRKTAKRRRRTADGGHPERETRPQAKPAGKREREPDPLSPFAALAALRDELSERER